ncbi:MAG TPA: DUF3187 family protein [Gemmatimonadales bacterium]|nr:DUF3187 family protein [Gemmatimonadales bacterium]
MTRSLTAVLCLATLAVSPPPRLAAQSDLGLPAFYQSNILATARSPLYFQPWVAPRAGTRYGVALDYANIYEFNYGTLGGSYVQDLELATLHLAARRDLSPTTFVTADLPVSTAWKGGLDAFLKWWHGLLGIEIPERDLRPENRFGYQLVLPDGKGFDRAPATYLGDLRLGGGRRFGAGGQVMATVTLPTTTADGYGRRVPSAGAMVAGKSDLDPRLRVEGTAGLGYAPRTGGVMRRYERDLFVSMGGGFRWRFYRGTSMFGTLWWHSPYYARTSMGGLDRADLAFDFGWIFRTRGGAEWRVGMAEDPNPSGPGVDAVFKASRSW